VSPRWREGRRSVLALNGNALRAGEGLHLVAAGAVFVAVLSIYGATLLPGVSSFDPAEMQTVPAVLGIAHPTGYPLWTLLGYLWTRLPVASPALLMNLLSAAFFAASAATLAVLCTRLAVRPIFAVVGGLTFAFAGETWARATQAEAHSLHTFLVSLLLLSCCSGSSSGTRAFYARRSSCSTVRSSG
jgi:hypothetical protein